MPHVQGLKEGSCPYKLGGGDEPSFSQLLVKEARWELYFTGVLPMETIDRYSLQVYGSLNITTNITDYSGKIVKQQDDYVSTQLQGYDIILGEP